MRIQKTLVLSTFAITTLYVSFAWAVDKTGPIANAPVVATSEPAANQRDLQSLEARVRTVEAAAENKATELARKDLEAQEGMACAAWAMFFVALASLVVSAATGAIVWLTLKSNNKVIGQSGQQLKNAATQLTNAEEQLSLAKTQAKQARLFGRLQLRAYIAIEKFTARFETHPLGLPGPFIRVGATVRNCGQTPAENVKITVQVIYVESTERDLPWPTSGASKSEHRGIIQPNGRMGPSFGSLYLQDQVDRLEAQTACLHLAICVTYQDVFGAEYERRASYAVTGKDVFKQYPTTNGNDERTIRFSPDEA